MLGSAVSSSTPNDFHPRSHMGVEDWPLMKRQAPAGVPVGCPYPAVGMHRALDAVIGLPRRSTRALWMLVFLMPADVRSIFMMGTFQAIMEHCVAAKRHALILGHPFQHVNRG